MVHDKKMHTESLSLYIAGNTMTYNDALPSAVLDGPGGDWPPGGKNGEKTRLQQMSSGKGFHGVWTRRE
jgi:hypothetical protein